MNILIVTLARGGSKGIVKKNLQLVGDHTLLDRAIDTAAAVNRARHKVTHVVSSDDDDILYAAYATMQLNNIDIELVQRPPELALDTSTSASAIRHAVLEIEARHSVTYDIIVELMCTAPFRTADIVDKCIDTLVSAGVDSVVTVEQIFDHHPRRLKYIDESGILHDVMEETPETRRQDLMPHVYVRAGGTYVFTRSLLFDRGRRWSEDCRAVVISADQALNIDEPRDLELARAIALQSVRG